MNADCAFWIGRTHAICQDYALAEMGDGEARVVLADGCSSSRDTDFGARLLVKAAQNLLRDLSPGSVADWQAFHETAAAHAVDCAERLRLEPTCLDATLLTIRAAQDQFVVSVCGDGVVALGHRDERVEVSLISYAANYPFYASYGISEERKTQWAAQPKNDKTVTRWVLGESDMVTELSKRPSEVWTGNTADYRFAAVLSDGVQSFAQTEQTDTSRRTMPVSVAEALAKLLAFPGEGRGRFVQRRAQAFRKHCPAAGWHHADDISLAVVWFDD